MNWSPAIGLAFGQLRRQKTQVAAALGWRSLYEVVPMQVPILTGVVASAVTGEAISVYGWPIQYPRTAVLAAAAIALFTLAVLQGVSSHYRWVASARMSHQFVRDMRKRVLDKLTALPLETHRRYGAGELLDRILTDTSQIRLFVERVFIQSVSNVLRVGYPVACLFAIDARLAAIVLSVLPPQWLLARRLHRRLHTATRRRRASQADFANDLAERLDGAEALRALHGETAAKQRLFEGTERIEQFAFAASVATARISGSLSFASGLGLALCWWLGGEQVLAQQMSVGTLVAFSGFVVLAFRPLQRFARIATTYRQGLVSLERIHELLEAEELPDDPPNAEPLIIGGGAVRVGDVRLERNGTKVLRGVSAEIPGRRLTAVVGRSGSGKSSLLRVLAGLETANTGGVWVDGQCLKHATRASTRATIALVPQWPALFSGTVAENVRVGAPDASDAAVTRACEGAFATTFVRHLPRGFETRLGRGGVMLSGGELQRLAIARALVKNPRILLMDEPTSALDPEAEAAIVESLRQLTRTLTVIVVAHRVRTISRADHVIHLDRGQAVASGEHPHLLANSTAYAALFAEARPGCSAAESSA